MDSFTEDILSRARDRQKLLDGYMGASKKTSVLSSKNTVSVSQPDLTKKESEQRPNSKRFDPAFKENSSEGNICKYPRTNSTTRVSSEITCSPQSQLKSFNIQNDNFNMEIKVSSVDNVRVEVQIEEHSDDDNDSSKSDGGLRKDAKNRLNRLGKLYAGGDDAEISSPIHRTEAKFYAEEQADTPVGKPDGSNSKKGLKKLADLANNMNEWEDNYKHVPREKPTPKKKPQAPRPPTSSGSRTPPKSKAPSPPRIVSENLKKDDGKAAKVLKWDRKVLDSLESQGFTRTTSDARLVYNYNNSQEKPKDKNTVIMKETVTVERNKPEEKFVPKSPQKIRTGAIANKAAMFESNNTPSPSGKAAQKDPALLSVSERKALFEKNKGAALIPKAPFAMNTPAKTSDTPRKYPAPKTPAEVKIETKPVPIESKPTTVQAPAAGIANTVAALLEGKSTISQEQIESSIKQERQKEMNMLLNRFNRKKEVVDEEEADDIDDVTEETAMLPSATSAKIKSAQTPVDDKRPSCSNKRASKGDSPNVTAILSDVKRIKVSPPKGGRLYPSLTDIESQTETDSHSPTPNSSFERSVESDDADTSLGRDILRAVCKNQTPVKRQIFDESGSSGMSDVLDDMDDYIDEALAYDETQGPTPPKRPTQGTEPSHSFNYKKFQANNEFKSPMKVVSPPRKSNDYPTYIVDGDSVLPLTHTVSFYRKQQTQSGSTPPVRQVSRQPMVIEEIPKEREDDEELIANRVRELQSEVSKQEMIISQTSRALNLCNSTREFMGSTEQVEAERVLLVATHRRQIALHELQRLKVENTLYAHGHDTRNVEKGTMIISKIVLPLKQKYVTALAAAGGKGHHVVCLIKCGDQVLPTPLVSTVATNGKNSELDLNIPGNIKLENVCSDSTITFEVYCLQAQEEMLPHDVKYHIKKSGNKLTPKKSKYDSRLVRPIKESPAGPHAVRSPTFALMGYIVFSMPVRSKRQWSLNNTPSMSPLDGTVQMCISIEMALSVEHRGFLTMFEDVSGFGAWHRRWCLIKGNVLSYWKYPDDERKVPPIDSISLNNCLTKNVGPVNRDICARPHTFLLERERIAYPSDKDTLVTICKGDKTVIRHLLSADTKEERIKWCNELNKAIAAIRICGDKRE